MANVHGCGCTGIRSCSLCQNEYVNEELFNTTTVDAHWFCLECENIFIGTVDDCILPTSVINWCEKHSNQSCSMSIEGISVTENFIDDEEESFLVKNININKWKVSQSGRRKQDFGPKANFKRKKLKIGSFTGLPNYSKFLVERMKNCEWLKHFYAVELCNLEYTTERGSSIDPHIDDIWLWGDVLVTLNLKSHTILTLTTNKQTKHIKMNDDNSSKLENIEIQIPMPRKSLLLLSKEARYNWLHSIKRRHIQDDRYAMTFRNLSDEFSESGPQWEIGKTLVDIANTFNGSIVI